MGKKLIPKTEFQAREYESKFQAPTAKSTLIDALRMKYPLYADNIAERFNLATGEELKWENINMPNLDRMVQYMFACNLADNSVRQYCSKLCAVLNLYRSLHPKIPSSAELASVMSIHQDQGYDAYLTDDDLDVLYGYLDYLKAHVNRRFSKYDKKGTRMREIKVLTHFLICADTGARSFDERALSWDNVHEGVDSKGNEIYVLVYTTNKRGVKASVPLAKDSRVIPLLKECTPLDIDHRICNVVIKKVCRAAGLLRLVKIRRASKDSLVELCDAVHFHVGRKSFYTNALKRGCSITDVMQFMGHTNPKQTMNYNCDGPTFLAEAIAQQRKAGNII